MMGPRKMEMGAMRRCGGSFWALLTVVLILLTPLVSHGAERPNVLILCADDLGTFGVGAYGNPRIRTPNIDRLASLGMRFDNAFCNSPICTASRQSFLTGRYPRSLGVSLLTTPLPDSETTLADHFSKAGYETAAIGKMHFNSPLKHGFELRIDQPEHNAWLKRVGRATPPMGVQIQPVWRPFKDPASIWLNSRSLPLGLTDEQMAGTFYARQADQFLKSPRQKPFFLMVSFHEPHSPFWFPVEFADRLKNVRQIAPTVRPHDERDIPEIFRSLTPVEKEGIARSYYTSVEYMDQNIGRVLQSLKAGGHDRNTLVIFLSDHGYMLGQHGRFEKHCSYEPAIRVPLIFSRPGGIGFGGRTAAMVELVDLAPTLLELCGLPASDRMQGRSFAPVLGGKTQEHRKHVAIEYGHNDEMMIRDGRWKLVYERGQRRRDDGYDHGRELTGPRLRLFDLQNDPEENRDLAPSRDEANQTKLRQLRTLMVAHLKSTARVREGEPAADDEMKLLDFHAQPRDIPRTAAPSR